MIIFTLKVILIISHWKCRRQSSFDVLLRDTFRDRSRQILENIRDTLVKFSYCTACICWKRLRFPGSLIFIHLPPAIVAGGTARDPGSRRHPHLGTLGSERLVTDTKFGNLWTRFDLRPSPWRPFLTRSTLFQLDSTCLIVVKCEFRSKTSYASWSTEMLNFRPILK